MLAAIKSLYASGTLSMKVGGAAGPSLFQQNGVRQGCPLSPTLFGILFDGLHGHLDCSLPHAGLLLGSGRWVSALVYADDVVLLSWTAAGLQDLLDSMYAFCLSLGLTISPSKTEVVVFNGSSSDTWHVGQHVLPRSASFTYLKDRCELLSSCGHLASTFLTPPPSPPGARLCLSLSLSATAADQLDPTSPIALFLSHETAQRCSPEGC